MLARNRYPAGVPCRVDIIQPDPDPTMAFYGDLFGWTFEVRTPQGSATALRPRPPRRTHRRRRRWSTHARQNPGTRPLSAC